MSTKETVKQLQEYVNVPLAELVESSTNPRKTFDEERLEELAESIRTGLAALIFESMLIGPAGSATVNKNDDLLTDAASHYKVDTKALHIVVAQAETGKAQKKNKVSNAKEKSAPKPKTVRK